MIESNIPEVVPYWSTIDSFLKMHANQVIEVRIANGGTLNYQVLGQMGRLRFEFSGDSVPVILSRWKAVQINQTGDSILILTNGSSDDGGLQGVHAIIESALRISRESEVQTPFADSLASALRQYRKLVASEELNKEVLLGLMGELYVLDGIRKEVGFQVAIESWHAKENSIHDFDMGTWDLEVKTTSRSSRIHRISSLGQLEPSGKRPLFLLSMHLVEAGVKDLTSLSLSAIYFKISRLVQQYNKDLYITFVDRVNLVLENANLEVDLLDSLDLPSFNERGPSRLIQINSEFPRITPSTILIQPSAKSRISNVEYDVDCDQLGTEDFQFTGAKHGI